MDEFAMLLLSGSHDQIIAYHRKAVRDAKAIGYQYGKAEAEEKVANAIGLTKAVC